MKPKKIKVNNRHGRGFASVEAALCAAVESSSDSEARALVVEALGVETGAEQAAQGMEARSVASALASCERPAGALLLECQGQCDLQLAERCVRKLDARMQADGRERLNDATLRDAIGAGVLALAVWRSTGRGADGAGETLAARVAWRAVVLSISADSFGESVALHSVSEDWLFAQALPRESRVERLVRWQVERFALGRSALLVRRVEALKARGGRGRRAQAVDRVGHAARLMLAGDNVDTAAARAGYKSSGRTSAANRLARALRACGLGIVGDARDKQANRPALSVKRVVPDTVQAFKPVAVLPVIDYPATTFQLPALAVTAAGRVVRYDVEAVTKSERRRERRVWQGVQRLARERGGWRPAVANGEWREQVCEPDGEWTRACAAAAAAVEASAGESGAAVRFYADNRTRRAGLLGVWA
jgi:hypothetical protein